LAKEKSGKERPCGSGQSPEVELTGTKTVKKYQLIIDTYGAHSQVDIYDDRIVITNPGGMFDGSEVQLLDIRHVPSKL
jgi:hypothetical protein